MRKVVSLEFYCNNCHHRGRLLLWCSREEGGEGARNWIYWLNLFLDSNFRKQYVATGNECSCVCVFAVHSLAHWTWWCWLNWVWHLLGDAHTIHPFCVHSIKLICVNSKISTSQTSKIMGKISTLCKRKKYIWVCATLIHQPSWLQWMFDYLVPVFWQIPA